MTITLNKQELRLAKFIANQRAEFNKHSGVKEAKVGKQDSSVIEFEGMCGEIAFCKLFNIYPDLRVEVVTQLNDDGDCTYKGKRVDVKTTSYKNGKLLTAPWKKDNVDLYALMIGESPTYEFKGFAHASELKSKDKLQFLGYNEVYCMEQHQLIKDI